MSTSFHRKVTKVIIWSAIIAFACLIYITFKAYRMPSTSSMEPTIKYGNLIILEKITYTFSEPKQGDLIVFKSLQNPKRKYLKRVIARGGEVVELKEDGIYINTRFYKEYEPSYEQMKGPYTVPEDSYYVLNDNINDPKDSRDYGAIPEDNIIGKVMTIFYWKPKKDAGK
jgi:signal peptidase I